MQGKNKGRGEQAAPQHREHMACDQSRHVGRVGGGREHQRGDKIGVHQKAADKDCDGGNARPEKPAIGDGQSSENEDIEQVGKEHVPLKDRDHSQRHEGINHKEEVMIDGHPIGRMASEHLMIHRP